MKKVILGAFSLLLLVSCEKALDTNTSYPASYAVSDMIGYMPASCEQYNTIIENPFVDVTKTPTSTFSIDADGASYANVRRFLATNQKPIADAIRTEELVNYFTYNYADPTNGAPIAVDGEVSSCRYAKLTQICT